MPTGEDARAALAIALAGITSLATGTRVAVPAGPAESGSAGPENGGAGDENRTRIISLED